MEIREGQTTRRAELAARSRSLRARSREIRAAGDAILAQVGNPCQQAEWNAHRANIAALAFDVCRYNADVLAYRAARATAAQTRANTAALAAVRSAACPRCYATHPGEC